MKKAMKKIRLMAILTGMAMMASNNAYSVSATIGYNTPSAVISELDGYTASTQLTEDGTIISTVTVNQRPDCKDVNLITKEEKAYRHREYNGKDFLISVTPTDEAAFVEAFGQSYCTAKQSDGTYILCGKESENLISEMGIYTSVAMLSDWERADAEKAFAQVCDSATVDSAKILQRYTEYTYDQGAFLLHLFSAKPITEERFDFLEDGYSVTIDADKNYPSVALMKDAVYVTDYTQQYQFYRSVLEQMPDVYAVYPYYWYLQTDSGSIGIDTIQEYQREENTYQPGDVDMNGVVDADDANKVLYEYLRVGVLDEEPEFTEEEFALANVYPDNLLDPNDACVILRYYLYTATLGGEPMTVTEFFERRLYLSEYGDFAKEG